MSTPHHPRSSSPLVALVIAVAASGCLGSDETSGQHVVARLEVARGEAHYAGLDEPETEAWGPSALRAGRHGNLWLVDSAGDQLVRLDRAGTVVETVDVGAQVVGAVDVLERENELWVLDMGANTPRIVRFDAARQHIDTTPLPEASLSHVDGFFETADHRALLQAEGILGCEVQVRGGGLRFCNALAPLQSGVEPIVVEFPDAPIEDALGHELVVRVGDAVTQLSFEHYVSSVRVLKATIEGELFISIEEVSFDPVVIVDATVLHIDARGQVVERARVPVEDQIVYVRHPIAIDSKNRWLTVITDRDGLDLVEIARVNSLQPILTARIERARQRYVDAGASLPVVAPFGDVGLTSQALAECRTVSEMNDTGFGYVNNATWLSTTNLDRAGSLCPGRRLPAYFGTIAKSEQVNADVTCARARPGTRHECVRSVPYDWGGADTVAEYRALMASGSQAGDADAHLPSADRTIEKCSRGVDCSGFITRIWNIPSYYPNATRVTTKTVANYSTALTGGRLGHPTEVSAVLQQGDILLHAGKHVTMFHRFGDATIGTSGGRFPYHLEATTTSSYDRAIYWYWGWSRFKTFEPRRFKRVCE